MAGAATVGAAFKASSVTAYLKSLGLVGGGVNSVGDVSTVFGTCEQRYATKRSEPSESFFCPE